MKQIFTDPTAEVVLATKDNSMQISRGVKAGRLRKLAPRLFTSNVREAPEAIIRRNLYSIISMLYPGAIISHRSSLEAKPTETGQFFITYRFNKRHRLPGVTLRLMKGALKPVGTNSFMGNLYISTRERAFLENLQASRRTGSESKCLSQTAIERRLDELCRVHGEAYLNKIRNDARSMAQRLGMYKEFEKLNKIIAAILNTHSAGLLKSDEAIARSKGMSYEPERLKRFEILFDTLQAQELRSIADDYRNEATLAVESFFEAYFSNYIEGTKFEINEALEIVYEGKIPENRPEGHDILGSYRLMINRHEMMQLPVNQLHFLELLKYRHKIMMAVHTHLRPGEFKESLNFAGTTQFVEPKAVRGTLIQGFKYYELLHDPLKKAIYMMFLVAEVHPFADGNGRIARLMMNSILFVNKLKKIIVPSVFRNDYLSSLKALTQNNRPEPFVKAMMVCLKFTSLIDFSSHHAAIADLAQCNAFAEPHEAKLII